MINFMTFNEYYTETKKLSDTSPIRMFITEINVEININLMGYECRKRDYDLIQNQNCAGIVTRFHLYGAQCLS